MFTTKIFRVSSSYLMDLQTYGKGKSDDKVDEVSYLCQQVINIDTNKIHVYSYADDMPEV